MMMTLMDSWSTTRFTVDVKYVLSSQSFQSADVQDQYLQSVVSPYKDVEGLNHQFLFNLYHKYVDSDQCQSARVSQTQADGKCPLHQPIKPSTYPRLTLASTPQTLPI
jgi:hypothetical protein